MNKHKSNDNIANNRGINSNSCGELKNGVTEPGLSDELRNDLGNTERGLQEEVSTTHTALLTQLGDCREAFSNDLKTSAENQQNDLVALDKRISEETDEKLNATKNELQK